MTKAGRVTIRNVDLMRATGVERSEAYRITSRLRVLGLFGIENDRGGNHHGRRFWRTTIETDAGALNAARHREAWSRIVAWARARRDRARAALNHLRSGGLPPSPDLDRPGPADADLLHGNRVAGPGPSFLELLVAGGLSRRLASGFGDRVQ
jgi:hypothetical protein